MVCAMVFLLAVFLFVVVVGVVDAGLPWPPARQKSSSKGRAS
jgi:hypothetical protein